MASTALLTRLSSTCWISVGDAWIVGRFGLSSVTIWTLAYRVFWEVRPMTSSTMSLIETSRTEGSVLRAKLRSL